MLQDAGMMCVPGMLWDAGMLWDVGMMCVPGMLWDVGMLRVPGRDPGRAEGQVGMGGLWELQVPGRDEQS